MIGTNYAMTIFTMEGKMVALTRDEIAEELIKFGIVSPVEVQDYYREYMHYYTIHCLNLK